MLSASAADLCTAVGLFIHTGAARVFFTIILLNFCWICFCCFWWMRGGSTSRTDRYGFRKASSLKCHDSPVQIQTTVTKVILSYVISWSQWRQLCSNMALTRVNDPQTHFTAVISHMSISTWKCKQELGWKVSKLALGIRLDEFFLIVLKVCGKRQAVPPHTSAISPFSDSLLGYIFTNLSWFKPVCNSSSAKVKHSWES